ncbi:thioesterase II family protein [Streptomyces sp. NBC_00151]|jgi:surfactin synthase thioesterase subunit|uniref:thioesterase II family protein n=1 Tax=Streptomyces sp. NBC_00151 TaxID=2975669 RepID=UPI002DDC7F7A|nr:alpha/beta fold hydrolase [Streptomyces sp. NBC_00151]WRZ40356.1 alpha/beta fold hydrolase [Streptomyces sp. NBC_00151]
MTWLRDWSHGEDAVLRVLCLPPAGASAHIYRRWAQLLPREIGVVAAELPGHGSRLAEPPVTTMEAILGPLCEEAATLTDLPLVVFGHSMGATLGAELCRTMRRELGGAPQMLIAAACEAPRAVPRKDYAPWLTEQGTLDFLFRMGGTPDELLANDEYLRMLLPVLRADLTVLAGPRPEDDRPLGCPVRVYLGERDSGVKPERAAEWRAESNGDYAVRTFTAGHFFVQEQVDDVLTQLCADLSPLLSGRKVPLPHS